MTKSGKFVGSVVLISGLLLIVSTTTGIAKLTSNGEALNVLDSLLRKYDRRSTPTDNTGNATKVSLELYVASLGSINTENMDYVTDTYLRQQWVDPRLAYANWTSPMDLADPLLVKAIWKPEVFFPNAKDANFQFVTVPNVLIRIHPNGEILYILRLRLKFSCMMELSRYPLDRQICGMQIASFSKTTRELQLFWSSAHTPVTVAADLKMPQFTIEKVTPTICNEQFHMGNYSCLVAEFYMKRSVSFHLIQSYLPSILIVAVSWVSFWMDIESVPGRISLGVITLLAVSSQAGLDKHVPQTSYVKAIDVWMGLCTAFVFAALVEFTIVNFWFRKRKMRSQKAILGDFKGRTFENGRSERDSFHDPEAGLALTKCSECGCQSNQMREQHQQQKRHDQQHQQQQSIIPSPTRTFVIDRDGSKTVTAIQTSDLFHDHPHSSSLPSATMLEKSSGDHPAEKVDQACRFLFPLGFAICNIFYWLYYLYVPEPVKGY